MSACARRPTPRPLSALFGENLILRNQGSGSRDVLERVLEERNHHVGDFRHIVEISDLFVIKELVKADCGITFLYRKAVEKELADQTRKDSDESYVKAEADGVKVIPYEEIDIDSFKQALSGVVDEYSNLAPDLYDIISKLAD